MPSKDPINEKANAWMAEAGVESSAPVKPRATDRPVRVMSAQIQRIAKRLHVDPDELARKIPEDTLRRTKYGVIEIENEDGTRSFKHDPGVETDRRMAVR